MRGGRDDFPKPGSGFAMRQQGPALKRRGARFNSKRNIALLKRHCRFVQSVQRQEQNAHIFIYDPETAEALAHAVLRDSRRARARPQGCVPGTLQFPKRHLQFDLFMLKNVLRDAHFQKAGTKRPLTGPVADPTALHHSWWHDGPLFRSRLIA